jgi:hypothetical protein
MPTGYTAAVEDGTVTELKPFALACARAFGALISMRDDPMDAPLPERVKPLSSYYEQESSRLADELGSLEAMTPEECAAAQGAALAKEQRESAEYVAVNTVRNGRHAAMAEKVHAWEPPSELANLKTFMLQQLAVSMHEPYTPEVSERVPATEWRDSRVAFLRARLESTRKHMTDEAERLREANEWLAALRAAL